MGKGLEGTLQHPLGQAGGCTSAFPLSETRVEVLSVFIGDSEEEELLSSETSPLLRDSRAESLDFSTASCVSLFLAQNVVCQVRRGADLGKQLSAPELLGCCLEAADLVGSSVGSPLLLCVDSPHGLGSFSSCEECGLELLGELEFKAQSCLARLCELFKQLRASVFGADPPPGWMLLALRS